MTSLGRPTPRRVAGRVVVALAIAISASLSFAIPAHAAVDPKVGDPGAIIDACKPVMSKGGLVTPAGCANSSAGDAAAGTGTTTTNGNVNFNTDNIRTLSNWLDWLALLSCIIGIFISASLWALGSKGQNPGQELTGKKGMILCCTAAFFVGALPNMLNWLEGAAHSADTTGVTGSAAGNVGATQGLGNAPLTGIGGPGATAGQALGNLGPGAAVGNVASSLAKQLSTPTLGADANGVLRCLSGTAVVDMYKCQNQKV